MKVKAMIRLDVPEYQIGQEVSCYFKDTMSVKGVCEVNTTSEEGEWLDSCGNDKCSECGAEVHDLYVISDATDCTNVAFYCPHCGTKMKR